MTILSFKLQHGAINSLPILCHEVISLRLLLFLLLLFVHDWLLESLEEGRDSTALRWCLSALAWDRSRANGRALPILWDLAALGQLEYWLVIATDHELTLSDLRLCLGYVLFCMSLWSRRWRSCLAWGSLLRVFLTDIFSERYRYGFLTLLWCRLRQRMKSCTGCCCDRSCVIINSCLRLPRNWASPFAPLTLKLDSEERCATSAFRKFLRRIVYHYRPTISTSFFFKDCFFVLIKN